MNSCTLVEQDWPFLLSLLPQNLDEIAQETGAIRRRRAVDSASTLLRLLLAYACCDLSLRETAEWAHQSTLASLSDVALLKRFRNAVSFLGELLTHKLAQNAPLPPVRGEGRLRLIDATAISQSGSRGTDWRVHASFDLQQFRMDALELTSAKSGESLHRFRWQAGEVGVADRGYGSRQGISACKQAGAEIIVRLSLKNCPLQTRAGEPLSLLAVGRGLGETEVADRDVETVPLPKEGLAAVHGRLVVLRKSAAATQAGRKQVAATAKRKGRRPDPEAMEAAGYVFLFTTLCRERFPASAVLELYRFRWQVEVLFRRLKGVLRLGELTAHDPLLARSVLLAKLLAALLGEELCHRWVALSPWGWGTPPSPVLVAAVPCGHQDAAAGDRGGALCGAVGRTGAATRPLLPRSAPSPRLSSRRRPLPASPPAHPALLS